MAGVLIVGDIVALPDGALAGSNRLLVCRLEGLGDLPGDRERLIDQDRARRDAMREIVALDQFHHEGGDTATLFEPVHNGVTRKALARPARLRSAPFGMSSGAPKALERHLAVARLDERERVKSQD